ncbi:hypothetical protein V6N13_064456 [Hibiscus sabdariffa]
MVAEKRDVFWAFEVNEGLCLNQAMKDVCYMGMLKEENVLGDIGVVVGLEVGECANSSGDVVSNVEGCVKVYRYVGIGTHSSVSILTA